jgi:hypothetical protein
MMYRVWYPAGGETEETGTDIDAPHPYGAAERWAEQHDEGNDLEIVNQDHRDFVVKVRSDADRVITFSVYGEAQLVYHAKAIEEGI